MSNEQKINPPFHRPTNEPANSAVPPVHYKSDIAEKLFPDDKKARIINWAEGWVNLLNVRADATYALTNQGEDEETILPLITQYLEEKTITKTELINKIADILITKETKIDSQKRTQTSTAQKRNITPSQTVQSFCI